MAFKSKQREKHGHLFGDDPLSASVSDDPLSATSSRSASPANSQKSTSIFGGIDVSKLSRSSSSNSNGYGKHQSSTTKRSTLASQDDESHDESLFGGKPSRSAAATMVPSASSPARRDVGSNSSTTMRSETATPAKSASTSVPQATLKARPPPPPPPARTSSVPRAVKVTPEDEATRAFAADTLAPSDPDAHPPTVADATSHDTDSDELNPWKATAFVALTPTPPPTLPSTQPRLDENDKAVFADLIASWNNPHASRETMPSSGPEDVDQFYTQVAVEQRDIGFAGIADEGDQNDARHNKLQMWGLDDNPWS